MIDATIANRLVSVTSNVDVDGDGRLDTVVRDTYGGAAVWEEAIRFTVLRGGDAPLAVERSPEFLSDLLTVANATAGCGRLDPILITHISPH